VPELRSAGPEAAAELAALHGAAFSPTEAWGAEALRLMLETPGTFALFSPGEGFILARVVVDEAEVLTLAVVPAARRQGLGRALLEAALGVAEAAGARQMFLEVSTANPAARALYAAAGFTEVGRRRRYYADGSDALVLSRRPCGS